MSGATALGDEAVQGNPAAPWSAVDRLVGWVLFAGATLALLATERPIGFVRDESVYFHAAESAARWFQLLARAPSEALGDAGIVRFWDVNHEHPALMKSLFGLSYLLLHEGLGWLRPAAAFRVPAFLVAALVLPLTYALARHRLGRVASAFAALAFLLVPRQYYEAHLACFDVPMATAWLLTVYAYHRAQSAPRWWWYTGVAFGLSLATKHNGWFIPLTLLPFACARAWTASRALPSARALALGVAGVWGAALGLLGLMALALGPQRFQASVAPLSPQAALAGLAVVASAVLLRRLAQADVRTFRAVAPLVAMAALGPLVFYAHWPYLWHHPVERTAWYLNFHATHNHYAWFYLGRVLREPPFPLEYVVLKTALTVPTSLFVPMVLGLVAVGVSVVRGRAGFFELLVAANGLASILLISHPDVPHFGGVKHWFASMPFLAILGAASLERGGAALAELLRRVWPSAAPVTATAALALLLGAAPLVATVRLGRYGTSAYSELAGGLAGAASLGMQRQFWAGNVVGVLDWINENARPGERVYLHENHNLQVRDYVRNGMLRGDLGFVGSPFQADLVAYQYHQEFREHEFNTWEALGTTRPVTGLYLEETPQIVVYRRAPGGPGR